MITKIIHVERNCVFVMKELLILFKEFIVFQLVSFTKHPLYEKTAEAHPEIHVHLNTDCTHLDSVTRTLFKHR